MKICIEPAGLRTVAQSGVGQAAKHQRAMLARAGVAVTERAAADAVHINTVLPAAVWAAWRARRQGKAVISYGHSTPQDFRDSFTGSNLLAPLFARWLRFCYNLGDIVITPTPYAAKRLAGLHLKRPVYVLSNGVDTGFFAPDAARGAAFRQARGLAADTPLVVSAGHFMRRKGIVEFIALARALPTVRFLWFGHTAPALVPRAVRRAMAAAPANLTFAGFVPQGTLRDALCAADAFVFCSHEETEGIAVLEALACGTPTVVRDIPVYDGWLQDGVEVCKARDTAGFVRCVRGILNGRIPAAPLAAAGRAAARARSLTETGWALCQIYRRAGIWRD